MTKKLLHLGCGKRFFPGATHIDIGDFSHLDYRHDIRQLPMIADGSYDIIYASHCFGYFDPSEVPSVLAEWKRVLKPGGILRLAVPNFSALCELYRNTSDINRVLGMIFGRWLPNAGVSGKGRSEDAIFQKTIYDSQSLSKVLLEGGFVNPRIWNWREVFVGELAGYDDHSQAYYPHMDKEHGMLLSLNMEADVPAKP